MEILTKFVGFPAEKMSENEFYREAPKIPSTHGKIPKVKPSVGDLGGLGERVELELVSRWFKAVL